MGNQDSQRLQKLVWNHIIRKDQTFKWFALKAMLITIYSIFKFWCEVGTTQSNSWDLELGLVQAKYKGTLVIHLGKKCSVWWWRPLKNGWGLSWSSNQDQKGACLNSIHAVWILFLPFLVWWQKGHCLSLWLWLCIPQCWISRQKRDETQLHFNKVDWGPSCCLWRLVCVWDKY